MEYLISAWQSIYLEIANLLFSLLLIFLGYLVARGLSYALVWVLKMVQLDKGLKRIGFSAVLERGDVKKTSSELLGDLVYWLVIFLVIIAVAKRAGLPIEIALVNVFSYLGLVFMAAITLGIGLFLASLLAGIVKFIALNFGLESAKALARVIYYIVIIFAFLAALAQLGVKVGVIGEKIDVIVGAVGLAAAIAFGLGCKDMAADFLHNLFKGK